MLIVTNSIEPYSYGGTNKLPSLAASSLAETGSAGTIIVTTSSAGPSGSDVYYDGEQSTIIITDLLIDRSSSIRKSAIYHIYIVQSRCIILY